ncbi:MAG: energy transducer TonB [Verrucomicrobiota bacterium]
MSPFAYAAGIITFATWLSVIAIGGSGMIMTGTFGLPVKEKPKDPFHDLEAVLLTDDLTANELPPEEETDPGTTGEAAETEVPLAPEETLPEPPELEDEEEMDPLPEVPDLPAPKPAVEKPKPVKRKPRPQKPVTRTGGSAQGQATARGTAGQGGRNGGSGMSDAKRMGGGRMPPPSYPAAARRAGHTGTVVVEFVVGENGSVISSHAKRSCPWPELNDAAVRGVRRWKFPPGKVSKYIRPITFKLN